MKVTEIEPHGFCGGVTAAVKKALEAPFSAYCVHEIVHNESVTARLRERGMKFVEKVEEIPDGATALFSAHGVPPAVRAAAERKGLKVIDATCPFVERVHREAREYAQRGLGVVVVGHAGHAEVEGVVGEAAAFGKVAVVRNAEEAERLGWDAGERVGVVSQTTITAEEARGAVEALRRKFAGVETSGAAEVCTATADRQNAVRAFAEGGGDGVLVLGSANSSNTRRLAEIAEAAGARVWRAGTPEEVEAIDFGGVEHLGVTSGASTPEDIFDAVMAALRGS